LLLSSFDRAPPEVLLRIATFRFSEEPQRCQGCEPERAPEGLGLDRFEVSALQKKLDGDNSIYSPAPKKGILFVEKCLTYFRDKFFTAGTNEAIS
jgi:hypothetical protein